MNILLVFYTFNRPNILKACLNTCLANTNVKPTEALIIDDASEIGLRKGLFEFAVGNSDDIPFTFINLNKNNGIGHTFELGHIYTKFRSPDVVAYIETDHVFRVGWLEEAIAVLKAKPETVGIPIYSNPDYYDKSKTEEMFGRITVDDFGSDLAKRQYLHKPFKLSTEAGEIEVQMTDHSCGSFILNWRNVENLMAKYPEMQTKVFDRAFNKSNNGDRRRAGDGPLTGGLSWYWYKHMFEIGASEEYFENHGPWLDICDYSMAQHINGGGLNGYIVKEGQTFVGSPKWKDEYLTVNPRNKQTS